MVGCGVCVHCAYLVSVRVLIPRAPECLYIYLVFVSAHEKAFILVTKCAKHKGFIEGGCKDEYEEDCKLHSVVRLLIFAIGDEYRLNDGKTNVDGFITSTNTVIEFHGDYFHGNPATTDPREKPQMFWRRS